MLRRQPEETLTLGIEEEFQLVDARSGELAGATTH